MPLTGWASDQMGDDLPPTARHSSFLLIGPKSARAWLLTGRSRRPCRDATYGPRNPCLGHQFCCVVRGGWLSSPAINTFVHPSTQTKGPGQL